MSEHTPGPWQWSGVTPDGYQSKRGKAAKDLPGVFFSRELVSGQQWVMETGVDFGSGLFDIVVATEADANLISAAPDLYEALQAIHAGFIDGTIRFAKKRQADSDPYHPANTLMSAALAKARGAQP